MAMKKESLNNSYKDLQPQRKSEESEKIIDEVTSSDYKYGFVTDIDTEVIPKGLNEDIVRLISSKKNEPEWLLDFRLKAFAHWKTLEMPRLGLISTYPKSTIRLSAITQPPKRKSRPKVSMR